MLGVTIAVLALAITAVLLTKPKYWIAVFLYAMALYPNFMTIPLGTVDFNITRILIIVIITSLLLNKKYINNFKLILLDKLIILGIITQFISYAFTTPPEIFIENRAGSLFDTVLPYFMVRIILTEWKTYTTTLKLILILMVPLSIVGMYQSITSHNPVGFMAYYRTWGPAGEFIQDPRHGFYRANFTFPMSIMFGLFFAMLGPACAGLLKTMKKKSKIWVGIFFAGLGTFSSMSAGPFLAAFMSTLFIAAYKFRKYWKIVLWIIILGLLAVEIISNRHFYNVLCRFSFSTATAWYRVRLIEVAFFEGGMNGHWLFGYGTVDPGWGLRIDYRHFTDIVNHYILILCRFGLVGFIPFIVIIVEAIRNLSISFKKSFFEAERWLVWCMSGALFGLLFTLNSVSLFGQPDTLLYMMFAICGSMPIMIKNKPMPSIYKTTQYKNNKKIKTS